MSSKELKNLLFVYGTLKTGQPNTQVMFDQSTGGSELVGKVRTVSKWPLVITSKFNIPFLLRKKGDGNVSSIVV